MTKEQLDKIESILRIVEKGTFNDINFAGIIKFKDTMDNFTKTLFELRQEIKPLDHKSELK
jgi:hypothetical protein